MVILLSELDAYQFLREKYPIPNEMHHERLILRGPTYLQLRQTLHDTLDRKKAELLSALSSRELLNPSYEERQWFAAFQLRDSLNERFDCLAVEFSLKCLTADGRFMTDG